MLPTITQLLVAEACVAPKAHPVLLVPLSASPASTPAEATHSFQAFGWGCALLFTTSRVEGAEGETENGTLAPAPRPVVETLSQAPE